MNNNGLKIGACIMVHNMAPFIGACVQSLQWTDGIFIYDDHSTDGGADVAQSQSEIPVKIECSKDKDIAFKKGELETRNYVIDRAFKELDVDILVIADADELFSSALRSKIIDSFKNPNTDGIAFSIWHLYNEKQYIHFWETKINGVDMIDPHTRIIKRGRHFVPLFEDGSHPILEPTKYTTCFHGSYHFHLKYHYKSTLPNYSIYFLPERPEEKDILPYLRPLPFELPDDVKSAISLVHWNSLPLYKETPHHPSERVKFTDPSEALIHPKDKGKYMINLERGKDVLLFYEKHKWDYVETYSKRSISGFYAWYTLLVRALKENGYRVYENDYKLALANPTYPIGVVGTPNCIQKWSLPNPAILGPSMYDNPSQNPDLMKDQRFKYYLLTCNWLKDVFEKVYGNTCVLWYAGISTEEWANTKSYKKSVDVLIYDKIRWEREKTIPLFLDPIKTHLDKKGLSYFVLPYGNITHEIYKDLLGKSRSMVFLCEHETQGIAYQEALASNVPIVAWDHGWWTDPVWPAYSENPIPATSVPNFSKECGEKFKMISDFPKIFERFWINLDTYTPRTFIESEVSFRVSADLYIKYYFSI